MKKIFKNKFLNLIILCLSLTLVLSVFSTLVVPIYSAKADSVKADFFLPSSELEYRELSSPIDVYSDDTVTAIVLNTDPNSLLINYKGVYSSIDATQLTNVKKLNQNTLIFSSAAKLRKIDLTSFDSNNPKYSDLELHHYHSEAQTFFDLNENFLVTTYQSKLGVFSIDGSTIKEETVNPITIEEKSQVAINQNNDIFYVLGGQLYKINATELNKEPVALATVSPTSKIIADNNFVYYVYENKIFRLSIDGGNSIQLTVKGDEKHQLGNLSKISGISFRNGNLLVCDTDYNAVQEFMVDNDRLIFTGFAITSGKTAYNRVSSNAIAIDKSNSNIAILDDNKISVINTVNNDRYNPNNFYSFFSSDFNEEILPGAFSLGNQSMILSFNHSSSSQSFLKSVNLKTHECSERFTLFSGNIIEDLTYQSGFYYLIATENTKTHVYKIPENNLINGQTSFDESFQIFETASFHPDVITADVFGNVYLAKSDSGEIKVYKKTDNYQAKDIASITVSDITTDLGGRLFILNDDGISYYNGATFTLLSITPPQTGDKIKSFAMNFQSKEVYLLYNNKEYVAVTNSLNNLALSEIVIPDTYVTTSDSANIDSLKFATVNSDANKYAVEATNGKFDYKGLTDGTNQYVVICDIVVDDTLTLTALAEKNGVILVNEKEVTKITPTQHTAPNTAFVTTDVSAYYMPLITANSEYVLNNSGNAIRIDKNTKINPICSITIDTEHNDEILPLSFYYCSFDYNGNEIKGYIPQSFTVPVLSEDFVFEKFSVEKIGKTTLYKDSGLTEEIQVIENCSVRVLKNESNVCYVAYQTESGWINGYISNNSIVNEPNVAIRNILIILAVTASVCGTSTFFILRKKD